MDKTTTKAKRFALQGDRVMYKGKTGLVLWAGKTHTGGRYARVLWDGDPVGSDQLVVLEPLKVAEGGGRSW